MKKSLFGDVASVFGFAIVSFGAGIAFAQGGASGLVYVPGPFECSQACTSDLMCASWNFTPMNKNSNKSMGQCKLSNSPNLSQIPGTISGLPQRATPQNQVYYSNQISQGQQPQMVPPHAQNQIPDWKPVQPIMGQASPYSGNYAIKPLNQPVQKSPILAQNPPAAPMGAAPQMIVPSTPAVVYAPKPPVQPMQQVMQPAPIMQPNPQMVQPAKPLTPPQMAPMAAYAPPQPAQYKPVEAAKPLPKTTDGPLRAPMIKAPKPAEIDNSQVAMKSAQPPQYMPAPSYQGYKSAGSPQYSVQNEWNNVADAVAAGKNTTNIDWSKTKPVMTSENDAKPKAAPEKKSWFQNIFGKKEETLPQEQTVSGGIGPLRKN